MFTAPACVIRQYADNMLYALEISLTTGKRWRNGRKSPYTDETAPLREKANETRRFLHSSVD
jgi:hypothetical protein